MPLEDFFTLAEMKDGLATLARVEELVGFMKEKETIIKNAGDAGRQWSTVASVLAATEDKESLQHFIELDGLQFLDQWLQEAQKFSPDTNEKFPEESINALLGALEKLPVDNELPAASGIGLTVKNLLDHRNFEIQQRARALYGNWNHVADESPINKDSQEDGPCLNELRTSPDVKVTAESLSPGVSTSKGSAQEGNCTGELSFKHSKIMNCSDTSQVEATGAVEVPAPNQAIRKVDVCGSPGNASSSRLSAAPSTPGKIVSDSSSPGLGDNDAKSSHVSELRGKTDCVEDVQGDMHVKDCSPSHPCKVEDHVSLPDSPTHSLKSIVEASLSRKIVDTIAVENDVQTSSEALQHPPDNGCTSGTMHSPENSLSENEVSRAVDDVKEHANESSSEASEGENFVSRNDILKPLLNASSPKEMNKRNTDIELDYGEDDALEVARWVAKEVEREVVDYRGPFCSSSPEKNSEGGITGPDSPYSTGVKQDEPIVDKTVEINAKPSIDKEHICGSPEAKRLKITKCEGFKDDSGLSSPIALPQELVVDSEKSRCDFDLNEEVCTEENDCPVPVAPQPFTLAAPIPVVATSKGVPTLPSTPLHFGGELGWRGSASTSAFRPPSPRKTPDVDKTSLVDASSNGSKQRQSPLKIDLNVASDENEVGADLASTKHAFVPSSLPSRESSMEVCSKRTERPILDLNRLGDSDDTCLFPSTDWNVDGRFQNGHHSQSPASSSSSRPPVRNFDLNDSLFFVDNHVSHDYRQNLSKAPMPDVKNYGNFKLDDPMSVSGSRIDVNRRELFNRATSGQGAESVFNANLARLGGASGPQPSLATPIFGYSDLAVGPTMPFQLQMYGPPNSVPYMVDSRGASVIPQILGSSTTIPAPSFSQPPFFMSLPGAPTDSSGTGFSQSGLDLNSGMALMDGERRDSGSVRQFFGNAHSHSGGSVEEQFMSSLHPAGTRTGVALKRKEPERGWELNMVGYKQEASWH